MTPEQRAAIRARAEQFALTVAGDAHALLAALERVEVSIEIARERLRLVLASNVVAQIHHDASMALAVLDAASQSSPKAKSEGISVTSDESTGDSFGLSPEMIEKYFDNG